MTPGTIAMSNRRRRRPVPSVERVDHLRALAANRAATVHTQHPDVANSGAKEVSATTPYQGPVTSAETTSTRAAHHRLLRSLGADHGWRPRDPILFPKHRR
jgi:hypothetical protein